MSRSRSCTLLFALAVWGCNGGSADRGPLVVSVIGPAFAHLDPGQGPLAAPAAVLIAASAQGLVRFDEAGEVRPGLAQRWAVSDDGLTAIFRIPPMRLARGGQVDARLIARRIEAARRLTGPNPLAPLLGAIAGARALTPEMLEIELSSPRPNLLQLLAQPDLAVMQGQSGGGPFAATRLTDGSVRLSWRDDALDPASRGPTPPIRLRADRAALAIVRFRAAASTVVLGGTMATLPLVRMAGISRRSIRFDPAVGLFGLAFQTNEGAFADPRFRMALAMAIDRNHLIDAAPDSGWQATTRLVPEDLDDLDSPATPEWAALSFGERRGLAAEAIARLRNEGLVPARVTIALPPGLGSAHLFRAIAADWRAIGITLARVDTGPADLRLVDGVQPADTAAWVLRQFTCDRSAVCVREADAALLRARIAPALQERSALLAEADQLLSERTVFIPLARPLRWSLVPQALAGFTVNRRAVHPLGPLMRRGDR